jgi:hypothetical protein
MSDTNLPTPAELDEYPPRAERDRDPETPEADAAEQRAEAEAADQPAGERWPERIPLDANEADATEQYQVVEGDEEEYR